MKHSAPASAALVVFLVACGAESTRPLTTPTHASSAISAEKGGTIVLDDGSHVAIPAGALTQDTEVGFVLRAFDSSSEDPAEAPLPDLKDHLDLVVTLVPDAVRLSERAIVSFMPNRPIDPRANLGLRVLSDGDWRAPERAAVDLGEDGGVTAYVDAFGTYAFVATPADTPTPALPIEGVEVHVLGDGQPMADVPVQLWGRFEELIATENTSRNGVAQIRDVEPGVYSLIVQTGSGWCGPSVRQIEHEAGLTTARFEFEQREVCD